MADQPCSQETPGVRMRDACDKQYAEWYRAVAHTVGIEHVTDGRDAEPGPLSDVLSAIGQLQSDAERGARSGELGVVMAKLDETRGMLYAVLASVCAHASGDPEPDFPTVEELRRVLDRSAHDERSGEPDATAPEQTTQEGAGASSDAAPNEREAATRSGDAAPAPGAASGAPSPREFAEELVALAVHVRSRLTDDGRVLGWRGLHMDLDGAEEAIAEIRKAVRP